MGDNARVAYAEAHPVGALLDLPRIDPGGPHAHHDLPGTGRALVFAPAALAQDDNPTGDDVKSSPTATAASTASAASTPSATPTAKGTPTASGTVAAAAQYKKSATALPDTGGSVPTTVLAIGTGALLVAGGLLARRFMG